MPRHAQAPGKAVLVWRGECPFIDKAANAQAAGAAAVIVVTDESGALQTAFGAQVLSFLLYFVPCSSSSKRETEKTFHFSFHAQS